MVDAGLGHRGDALAPADQAGDLLDEQAGGSRRDRSTGAAVTLANSGDRAAPRSPTSASACGHLVGGGLHQRRSGRAPRRAAGSPAWRPSPWPSRAPARPRRVARDHDLRRVVVVGDDADLALRGRLGHGPGDLEAGAEQRGHRALAHRHRRAASPGRAASAGARWSASRRRRRRTARYIRRGCGRRRNRPCRCDADAFEHPQRRHRIGHDRRLGVLGEGQLVLAALRPSAGTASAERLVHLLEHLAGDVLASASALPMPTAWLPWPGKMNARMDVSLRPGLVGQRGGRGQPAQPPLRSLPPLRGDRISKGRSVPNSPACDPRIPWPLVQDSSSASPLRCAAACASRTALPRRSVSSNSPSVLSVSCSPWSIHRFRPASSAQKYPTSALLLGTCGLTSNIGAPLNALEFESGGQIAVDDEDGVQSAETEERRHREPRPPSSSGRHRTRR